MKKITIISLLVLVIISVFYTISSYNGFVELEESVKQSWSQVENNYQRRADLIPNLVATVKGYASHEKGTLEGVIQARSQATQTKLDVNNLDAEQLANFQSKQEQLSQALSRLMVVVERYPELKANENFRDLQVQLEGTENRITIARKTFNETAQKYNKEIRLFPRNLVAKILGFEARAYFEAQAGAETAPIVDFNK